MNVAYIARLEARLEQLAPLVAERSISLRWPAGGCLVIRLDVRLIDGARFEGNEIWTPTGRKYRFHLLDPQGRLEWRFDNAPHHRRIANHPHHRHDPDGSVRPAEALTLEEVLSFLGGRAARLASAP